MTIATDDFNRGDSPLGSSPSAEGWEWTNVGFNGINIGGNKISTSSAIGWRRYRCEADLGTEQPACDIDVTGGTHGMLLLRVVDSNNFVYCYVDHDTGDVAIRQRVKGVNATLASTTITPPTPTYKLGFYMIGAQTHVVIDGVLVLSGSAGVDPVLLQSSKAGIGADVNGFGVVEYDNFRAGAAWELGFVANPQDSLNSSDPLVRRRTLDEQRRSALLGGRQNTILTSPLGLTDTVPVARVHLLGRC